MKRTLFILLFFGGALFSQIHATLFHTMSDSLDVDSEPWTEEQYEHYEDSIMNLFFPELQVVETEQLDNVDADSIERSNVNRSAITNSNVPDAINLDYSKSVGEIPIHSNVTPSGAKTYEVPIALCPGQENFMPRLSLVYNSQQGNSILGTGWGLSGLDAIARIPKSIYYDGMPEGVRMDNTDGFALNGVRLIRLSQTGNTILFETETGNIKINGHVDGDVMKYFEVFYPNGNKGIFGYESNTINKLTYPQMSLTDLRGNTMSFIYTPYGQQNYISDIYYSGGHVEFEYVSTRIDTMLTYAGGEKIEETHLLKKIVSKRSSSTLGTYTLSYDTIYERSLLSQIDYEANGTSLNPILFYYGEDQNIHSYNHTETHLSKYYVMPTLGSIQATFGRCEYQTSNDALIVWPTKVAYYDRNVSGKHIYRNKYTGNENVFIYRDLYASYASIDSLKTGDGFVEVLCADLTGSQQEDILKIRNIQSSSQDSVIFDVYSVNSYGQLYHKYSRKYSVGAVYNGPGNNKSVRPKTFHVGDFNGDGKMEVLVMCGQPTSACTYYTPSCHIYDLENNQTLYQGALLSQYEIHFFGDWETDPQTIANGTDRIIVCDYDGDGKSDLYHIDPTGTHVYTFQQGTSGLSSVPVSTSPWLVKSRLADSDLLVGDFNGDGLTDLFVTAPSSAPDMTPSLVFNSKGDGSLDRHDSGLLKKNSSYDFGLITQDVNSDGISDIIDYGVGGFSTYITFTNHPRETHYEAGYPSAGRTKLIPVNVSSRNTFSTLLSIKDNTVALYDLPLNSCKEAMITGMVNSHGIIEKNRYRRANEAGESVITPAPESSLNPTYPFIEVHEPFLVLDRSELFMNGTMVDFNKYGYGTAVYHRHGLGFRGFTSFTRNNYRGQIYYQAFDTERFCVPIKEITPTGQTDYTFSVFVDNNKLAHIAMTDKDEYSQMTGVSTSTDYTINSYGNPVSEYTTYSGSDISVQKNYGYDNNTTVGDGYYIGYPTSVSTTTTRGSDTYTEKIYATHDRCQPLTRTHTVNDNIVKREAFTYDSNGNKLTETVMPGFSSQALTTSFTYNGYGQPTSKTDPLGVTTSYAYDSYGNVTSASDTNGDMDQYIYDNFGKVLVHNHNSNLSIDSCSYLWSSAAPNSLYCISHSLTGKPRTKTYYDAMNREVRTSDQRFDSNFRHIDKTYDSYGRLSAVSLPYKSTSASYWNSYAYDGYDRITSFAEASGRTTLYTYSGLTKTITEDGIATAKTYDVLGHLISSTDPAGTVTYSLAADGQPNSITAPGNVTTTFTYNTRRWQTSITDPSAGTMTFEYNPEGTLYKTTDARSKVTLYYYDQTGRLQETWHPEFTINYFYNNRNQLTSVTATNGVSKQMSYDGNGRLSSWKETVDSVWLLKDYTYSNNNLASISYTSHRGFIASENYGYANGTMTTISKNGTLPVFQLTQENDLGMPTGVTTLNLTRTYGYTSTGIPTGRTASGPSSTILNESYSFNAATSNLLSRTDNIRNLTDQFTYDNLNQLSTYHGASAQYDAKGNITNKSDVGTFSYDNTSMPYALTGASATSGTISTNTQDITYYTFPRPKQIAEGSFTLDFTYDGDLDRVKEEVKQSGTTIETRYTLGGCYDYIIGSGANQKEENLFFAGGYYDAPILLQKYNDGSMYISHLVRDYQGSIMSQVDSTGFWHNDWSYDAWGRLRNPQTHVVYNPSALTTYSSAYRGYCGHEHLPQFGLINMNARLYDPITSRFLSPDPYVQMPDYTQSFNRYSYCLNNPLKYVDENGEEILTIFVIAVIAGTMNLGWQYYNGNVNNFWQGFAAFGVGAAAGALGAGVGGYIFTLAGGGAAGAGGFLAGAAGGGAGGAANSLVKELGNFVFLDNDFNGWNIVTETGLSAVAGGVFNGLQAVKNGKNFLDGSLTNYSIVQKAANYAEVNIGGEGHVAGSKKHAEAEELIRRYNNRYKGVRGDLELEIEKSVKINGDRFIRPDIIDTKNGLIYDFKFGYPKMTTEQLNMTPQMIKYREAFGLPSEIIRPQVPFAPIKRNGLFLNIFRFRF